MIELIQNYWGVIPLMVVMVMLIHKFIDMPTEEQFEQVNKWLLWAIAQAEIELGTGTNKLKLAMVYDMFVERFPWLAKIITYEKFSVLVDKALEDLKNMAATNMNVKELIYGHEYK